MRTWYSIFQFSPCFTFQTSDYDGVFLCRFSVIGDVIQKVPDKGTCREIDNVYQATCNNAVNIRGN